MAEPELKANIEQASDFDKWVVPTQLRDTRFDKRRSIGIEVGLWKWTAVPSIGALGGEGDKLDVRSLVRNPSSWLLLKRDSLDTVSGLELEVRAAGEEGEVDLRVLRGSGRAIAEGTARDTDKGVEFAVRVIGARVPRRKREGTLLTGVLDTSGRLRMKVGGQASEGR